MISPQEIQDLLNRIGSLLRRNRIRNRRFEYLDESVIERGLQNSTLTTATLHRFSLLIEGYHTAQKTYGNRFENVGLIDLVESFLNYIHAIIQRLESGTDLSYLALNTNEQLFHSTLNQAEERLSAFIGYIDPRAINKLFADHLDATGRHTLKLPETLAVGRFQPFYYLSWRDEQEMYLITKRNKEILGLQLTYTKLKQRGAMPMKMGFCDFCHGQLRLHHTAAITAVIPRDKLGEGVGYKSVGRYICIDHITCNRKLLRTRREEKIAAFIDSVRQNKPLIL